MALSLMQSPMRTISRNCFVPIVSYYLLPYWLIWQITLVRYARLHEVLKKIQRYLNNNELKLRQKPRCNFVCAFLRECVKTMKITGFSCWSIWIAVDYRLSAQTLPYAGFCFFYILRSCLAPYSKFLTVLNLFPFRMMLRNISFIPPALR